jgi:hypothetical protein
VKIKFLNIELTITIHAQAISIYTILIAMSKVNNLVMIFPFPIAYPGVGNLCVAYPGVGNVRWGIWNGGSTVRFYTTVTVQKGTKG